MRLPFRSRKSIVGVSLFPNLSCNEYSLSEIPEECRERGVGEEQRGWEGKV